MVSLKSDRGVSSTEISDSGAMSQTVGGMLDRGRTRQVRAKLSLSTASGGKLTSEFESIYMMVRLKIVLA